MGKRDVVPQSVTRSSVNLVFEPIAMRGSMTIRTNEIILHSLVRELDHPRGMRRAVEREFLDRDSVDARQTMAPKS